MKKILILTSINAILMFCYANVALTSQNEQEKPLQFLPQNALLRGKSIIQNMRYLRKAKSKIQLISLGQNYRLRLLNRPEYPCTVCDRALPETEVFHDFYECLTEKHGVCNGCFTSWQEHNNNCPSCRQPALPIHQQNANQNHGADVIANAIIIRLHNRSTLDIFNLILIEGTQISSLEDNNQGTAEFRRTTLNNWMQNHVELVVSQGPEAMAEFIALLDRYLSSNS